MAKKTSVAVNADQSAKSQNGTKNNGINTRDCLKWADGNRRRFVKAEPVHEKINFLYDGMVEQTYRVQTDQECIALYPEKKMALIVQIDGTTTQRGERVKTKVTEGAVLMCVTEDVERKVLREYPDLSGYKFIHVNTVIYPDHVDDGLKDVLKEERMINEFSVDVNYKTRAEYATTDEKNGIDAAMRIGELISALNDIIDHPEEYNWDKDSLAIAWIKQHNTFEFMPKLRLCDVSGMMRREHLLHCLSNMPYRYSEDELNGFMDTHGIQYTENTKKYEKIDVIQKYVNSHYPPQTKISLI